MKINIISLNNNHSLTEDIEMFCNMIKKSYKNVNIIFNYFNFQESSCVQADINIFIGITSNFFFKYSPINVFICDHHKFHISWIPFLNKCDYILTKNRFSLEILQNLSINTNIQNIGWKNYDRFNNSVEKDYKSFLIVTGQSKFRQLDILLDIWKEDYPKLTILCGKNYLNNNNIEKKIQDNINYIERYLPYDEFNKLLINNGFHFCLSKSTTHSNSLHNCLKSKSIPIYIDCLPFKEVISNNINGYKVSVKKKKKSKEMLGSEYTVSKDNLIIVIENIVKKINDNFDENEIIWEEMSENNKKLVRNNEKTFEQNAKIFLDKIRKQQLKTETINPRYEIFNEDLPKISIITPIYDRTNFFKLLIRNYEKIDYPKDKFEIIVVDDSNTNNFSDFIKDYSNLNINLVKLKDKITIGEKRNIAIENSQNNIIIIMDEDDYYPPSSIKYRVGCLEYLKKDIIGCCSMGVLEINKIISNLNVSNFTEPIYKRVFESSLCFRKSWWENHKFSNKNVDESEGLLNYDNIINHFDEVPYNNIIISLIHKNNTNKKINIKGETNGSHYNFSDELFTLITGLDNEKCDIELNQNIKHLQNKNKEDNKEIEDNIGDEINEN